MLRRISIIMALALISGGCSLQSGVTSKPVGTSTQPVVAESPQLDLGTRDELRLLGQLLDRRDVLGARLAAERLVGRVPADDPVFAERLAELDRQLTEQDVEVGSGFLWAHKPSTADPGWDAAAVRAERHLQYKVSPVWRTGVAVLRIRLEGQERENCLAVATGGLTHFHMDDDGYSLSGLTSLRSGGFVLLARPRTPNPSGGDFTIASLRHASPKLNLHVPESGVAFAGELMVRAEPKERLGAMVVHVIPEPGLALDGAGVHIGRRSAPYECSETLQSDGTCTIDDIVAGPCQLFVQSRDRFCSLRQQAEIRPGQVTNVEIKAYARRCVVFDWKYRKPSGEGEWCEGSSTVLTGRSSPLNTWGVNGSVYDLTDWDGTGAGIRGMNGDLRPADQADFDVPQVRASRAEMREGRRKTFPLAEGAVFAARYGYPDRGGEGEAVMRIRSIESTLSSTACGDLTMPTRPSPVHYTPLNQRRTPQAPASPLRPCESPAFRATPMNVGQKSSQTPSPPSQPVTAPPVKRPSERSELRPAGSPPRRDPASPGRLHADLGVSLEPAEGNVTPGMQMRDDLRRLGQILDRHEVLPAWALVEQLRGRVPVEDAMWRRHLAELDRQMAEQDVEIGNGYLWVHKPADDNSRWADVIAGPAKRFVSPGRLGRETGVAVLRVHIEKPDREPRVNLSCRSLLIVHPINGGYRMGDDFLANGDFVLFQQGMTQSSRTGRIEFRALCHASPVLDITVPESGTVRLGEVMLLAPLNPGLGDLAVQVVREPGLAAGNAMIHIGRGRAPWEGGYPVKEDGTCVFSGLVPGPCQLYVEARDLYRSVHQQAEIKAGEVTKVELKAYAPRKVVVDWKYRFPSGEGEWHEGSSTVLTGRSALPDTWGSNSSPYDITDWNGTDASIMGQNGALAPIDPADFDVPRVRASRRELQTGDRGDLSRPNSYPIAVGKAFAVRYGYASRGGEGEAVIRIRSIESTLSSATQASK